MALSKQELVKRLTVRPGNGTALVERLARGRDLRRRMTWPGAGLEIELKVLSSAEASDAHLAAAATITARGLDAKSMNPRSVEALATEEFTEILARAVCDPATHEPLAVCAADLAAAATEDELVALYNAYSDLRHEVDPEPDEMPESEFAAIDAALKKKDATLLSAIVSSMPRPWLRSTVLRLATSLTASSTSTSDSSSSPPSAPEADRTAE